ncbi:hypothetical protein DCS_03512 [Drechmeria coniospora]|uniref:Uncharacterized protein n=1 Tax=Drechmeria coniospora TaxID=98403 RepID=A0A151GHJ7_DRECN|nr:hypothetical protein DCS_03512 [Drechmeria coniospora]KYK56512.1 hypothetical protein DCS_03512 [Drechmeria coniospora]ODA76954.1 hypothetical protein RJ55_07470 [Drechmeria coniospora]
MSDAGDVVAEHAGSLKSDSMPVHRTLEVPLEKVASLASPTTPIAPVTFRRQGSLELDDYFTGPRDISRHSKWPIFLQMHGSILPKLILPLFFISAWATLITVLHQKVHDVGFNSVLLTILGFVVGLSLSFRQSTAYERYTEGRKYWSALVQASQVLGRIFWIHAVDRPDQDAREQMLKKISSMNLVVAFALALKHSLRFEPYTAYPDLGHLIGHLDTFAKAATDGSPEAVASRKRHFFRDVGEYLGISFAASNPRKTLKRASRPLGNLPLEILNHIAVTLDMLVRNEQLKVPMQQTLAYNNLTALNDALVGTERILCTPLPIAYSILISQITWLYVILLPFQLVRLLDWITIPATIGASFIILGLLFIGREIENPFGQDVNDLPLDNYCDQIAADLDIIASYDKRNAESFHMSSQNIPLYPVSSAPISVWMQRSEDRLRDALRNKPHKTFEMRKGWSKGSGPNSTANSTANSVNGVAMV